MQRVKNSQDCLKNKKMTDLVQPDSKACRVIEIRILSYSPRANQVDKWNRVRSWRSLQRGTFDLK